MTIPLLKQCDLFKKVSAEEIKVLIPLSQEKTFPSGSIIFTQNSTAERVYFLDQGRWP